MKSKLLCMFISCFVLVSCASHPANVKTQEPVVVVAPPPVQENPVVLGRADLPANWKEVKGETWSFGIPKDWSVDTNSSSGLAAACSSPDHSLLVVLGSDDADDLEDYGKYFAEHMIAQGGKLLHASRGKVSTYDNVLLLVFKMDNIIFGNLLVLEGSKVYTMGCGGPMETFKDNMHMCGEIAETLQLKP